jgi:predicted type IV restriction endonuclease
LEIIEVTLNLRCTTKQLFPHFENLKIINYLSKVDRLQNNCQYLKQDKIINIMDFKDHIRQLGERTGKLKDQIATEEATKNAFIMPFIQCLGYDVFNPIEVVPEFIADIGVKKGEKVDYAIFKDGLPTILIECKHWAQKLEIHDNQLIRYFNVTKAKFAILTNGLRYKFYTDLVEINMLDEKPFLEIDMLDIKDLHVEELKKFHKSYFDVNNILSSASELKFTGEIKAILTNELKSPTEEFVKYFAQRVYPKKITANVLFQFSDLVKKSVHQVISDMITDRLKSAIDKEKSDQEASQLVENTVILEQEKEKLVETTADEIEAFFIVKSILRTLVDASRITYRDAQSYFAIMLDDNNRKAICRIYLNANKKSIGVFDSAKKETKNEIQSLDDIYAFSEQLKMTVETYLALNS